MAKGNRPLSPHLQVYRLPLTALLSITHRGTGVFLSLGAIFLVLLVTFHSLGSGKFCRDAKIYKQLAW